MTLIFNLSSIIKRYWYLAILFLVAILVGSLRFLVPPSPPSQTQQETYKQNIVPGIASINDLTSRLGPPLTTTSQQNFTIFQYPSQFPKLPTQVFTSNNTVVFIKEPVKYEEQRSLKLYLEKYGNPHGQMFNPNLGPTFQVSIYPNQGIAITAAPDDIISEIWYFAPTSLNEFLNTWGKNLTPTASVTPDIAPTQPLNP